MHKAPFNGGEVHEEEKDDASCFNYGYALTVHHAQGSQWRSVVVVDDWHGNRDAWLYTGITRAEKQVTVINTKRR